MQTNRLFFLSGILFIVLALIAKALDVWWPVSLSMLCVGIAFKGVYLFLASKSGRVKWDVGLFFLFLGVGLVLVSLGFKHLLGWVVLAKVFLYFGVLLKFVFVVLFTRNRILARVRV